VGPDSGSFVVAGLPGVNMSQGLSRNNHSNRSLTVAAQNRVPRWYEKAGLLAGAVNSQLSALDTVQKETGYEKE
jgi:hypothetical protein